MTPPCGRLAFDFSRPANFTLWCFVVLRFQCPTDSIKKKSWLRSMKCISHRTQISQRDTYCTLAMARLSA